MSAGSPAEPTSPLHAGDVLAGRYRLEDLIREVGGSQIWRATDDVLNRSVAAQVLPASDPRAAAFLDGARASTAVTDPRFLRVLDASSDERGHAYVVREWARAVPLAALLREGPMDNRRAAAVVAEAATALESAHEAGRTHRRLDPSTVLVKDSGAVRIAGLGTDHALLGSPASSTPTPAAGLSALGLAPRTPVGAVQAAEQEDVEALGRLLYACLVARWPGGGDVGLPPAPTEHGRLLRPRQVRAGVSRDADTVCDRVLGHPPRNHEQPLRSAQDLAQVLALVGRTPPSAYDDHPSVTSADPHPFGPSTTYGGAEPVPPPALLPAARPPRRTEPTAEPVGPLARSGELARASVRGDRKWIWLAVVLLLAVTSVIAFAVGRATTDGNKADGPVGSGQTPASGSGSPTAGEPPTAQLPIASVTSFDPEGDGEESQDLAAAAVDDDLQTSWTTVEYYNDRQLGGLKRGVGLLLDLGREQQVSQLRIHFGATPTSYSVWVAPAGSSEAPTSLQQLREVAVETDAAAVTRAELSEAVSSRYVMLWLTALPEESEDTYVGVVQEISVRGRSR